MIATEMNAAPTRSDPGVMGAPARSGSLRSKTLEVASVMPYAPKRSIARDVAT
jgi:hypothetical protein